VAGKFGFHVRGEVFDGDHVGAWVLLMADVLFKENFYIEPFIRSVSQATVVKIEPVNVNDSSQVGFLIPDMKKPPGGGLFAPSPS